MKETTLSELRRDTAKILKSLATGPVVLNRDGRAVAVMIDPAAFQSLRDELDDIERDRVVKIIESGLDDWKAGRVTPHDEVVREARAARTKRRKASPNAERTLDKRG
jgi:PHD/YefM family antitoxin component YafN of YafNO toxin-antitoxin module